MIKRVWTCSIGFVDGANLPDGSDWPMRKAIERAFKEVTGHDAEFVFSGWGGALTPAGQREVGELAKQ